MFSNFLKDDDEEDDEKIGEREDEKNADDSSLKSFWKWIIFVFFLAFIPRLLAIFFLRDPQNPGCNWYEDVYHHWQIAYLTLKVGVHEGFRLWDLKGMEYFWGIGHPIMIAIIQWVTGFYDVVLLRVFASFFGSLLVVLIFLLSHRYWGLKVAIGAAIFGALNQVGIFNDATGMLEPIGLVFLLAAIYFWPKKSWATGLFLGLSIFMRAEDWVFAVGIFFAIMVFGKNFDKKVPLLFIFVLMNLLQMKLLLDKAANAIYPVYWNFMSNAAGKWMYADYYTSVQDQIRPVFITCAVLSVLGILWTVWKRPKYFAFFLLGFGNWFFISGMFGLTMYLKAYYGHLVWATRFFPFPYLFAGILLIIFLFKIFGKSKYLSVLAWISILVLTIATHIIWIPVLEMYDSRVKDWKFSQQLAKEVRDNYQNGRVLIPEGIPSFTYSLVHFQKFEAKDFVGGMFDPFFYMDDEDPFYNWGENREKVFKWLIKDNIRLLVFSRDKANYQKLIETEPDYFEFKANVVNDVFLIYKVKLDLIKEENL